MAIKEQQWPERRELVLGTVTRVNPFSAFISLDEYNKKEGMIHISEVAGKWVRDIREFVKVGQKVVVMVMFVDKEKQHISLSLKRVNRHDSEEKMREYKREQKAEKMLANLAKLNNVPVEDAYKEVGFKLKEIFGEIFKGFQMSLTPQGYEILIKKGISEKWANAIKSIAEKQLEIKEKSIKGIIELKCLKPNGISLIKQVLKNAKEKNNLEINYISAPKYLISLRTKDAKLGERKLREAFDTIVKDIRDVGGEGSFEVK